MMEHCEEYAALLDLYVDGELAADEMVRVQEHLAQCPGCRAYVDDALEIRAAFGDLEDTVVPEGFAEGVMERIRGAEGNSKKEDIHKKKNGRRGNWMRTVAALAACCAVAALAYAGPGGGMKDVPMMADAGYDTTEAYPGDGADDAGAAGAETAGTGRAASMETDAAGAEAQSGRAVEDSAEERGVMEYRSGMAADTSGGGVPEEANTFAGAAPDEAETKEESAMDSGALMAAAPAAKMAGPELVLTAAEVGELLDAFTPVWEDEAERQYQLSREAYAELLAGLGRDQYAADSAAGETVLVIVTGPF